MSDNILTRRRRFLQGAGIGSAALLAGCTGLDSDDGNGDNGDGNGDNGDGNGDNGDENGDNGDENGDNGDNGDENGDNGDENGDDEDEPEEPGEGERQAGVIASLGEGEQQAIQGIQLQLQQGEIDQEEAEAEMEDLLEPVIDNLTTVIESDVGGSVVETVPLLGAVRVNAPPDTLIDVLELDETDMLIPGSDLDTDEGQ